jgi:hypothetical protein
MAISPRANNGLDYGFLGIMSPQSPEKVSSKMHRGTGSEYMLDTFSGDCGDIIPRKP